MDTSELIDKLYQYHEDYGQGVSPSLFQMSMACKEAANKIAELQRFIDDMNGDHYVDYLEFYEARCRELENKLAQIQDIISKE